jgi:hypothetical protein
MNIIPKESFRKVLVESDASLEEVKQLVKEEFGMTIPNDIESREELLEITYDQYMKTMEEYKITEDYKIKKYKKKTSKESRKDWIINYIQQKSPITTKTVIEAVDKEFGYSEVGKSSRIRVKNVVKELVQNNKVILNESNTIIWK